MSPDIRWQQRLESFGRALGQMEAAVALKDTRTLSNLEMEGLVQRFEITQELAWKTIKDFYESQGDTNLQGSRDAFRLAFERGLITDGQVFMDTIKSRNLAAHTYREEILRQLDRDITTRYLPAFQELWQRLRNEQNGE